MNKQSISKTAHLPLKSAMKLEMPGQHFLEK